MRGENPRSRVVLTLVPCSIDDCSCSAFAKVVVHGSFDRSFNFCGLHLDEFVGRFGNDIEITVKPYSHRPIQMSPTSHLPS